MVLQPLGDMVVIQQDNPITMIMIDAIDGGGGHSITSVPTPSQIPLMRGTVIKTGLFVSQDDCKAGDVVVYPQPSAYVLNVAMKLVLVKVDQIFTKEVPEDVPG